MRNAGVADLIDALVPSAVAIAAELPRAVPAEANSLVAAPLPHPIPDLSERLVCHLGSGQDPASEANFTSSRSLKSRARSFANKFGNVIEDSPEPVIRMPRPCCHSVGFCFFAWRRRGFDTRRHKIFLQNVNKIIESINVEDMPGATTNRRAILSVLMFEGFVGETLSCTRFVLIGHVSVNPKFQVFAEHYCAEAFSGAAVVPPYAHTHHPHAIN